MNTAPHHYKLCSQISYIWGNHRGQHIQSAVDKPQPRKIIFIIIISPLAEKDFSSIHNSLKFYWKFHKHSRTDYISIGMVVSPWFYQNLSWSSSWHSRDSQIHVSKPLHLLLPKPFQKLLNYIVREIRERNLASQWQFHVLFLFFAIVTNYLV